MNVSNILRNDLRQISSYDTQNRPFSANRTATMTASGSAPQGTVSASVNGVAAQVYQYRDFAALGVLLADGSNQVVTVALGSGGVELARQTNSVYVPNAISLKYDSNGNGLGPQSDGKGKAK